MNYTGTFVYEHPVTRAMAPDGWCDDGWFHLIHGGKKYNLEQVPVRPEVIIEPAMLPGAMGRQYQQALEYWNRFANVPAVTAGRIHVIDGDVVSRLSPRLPAGIRAIARCLRPDLFGD